MPTKESESAKKSQEKIYFPQIGVRFRRDDNTYPRLIETSEEEGVTPAELLRKAIKEYLIRHRRL